MKYPATPRKCRRQVACASTLSLALLGGAVLTDGLTATRAQAQTMASIQHFSIAAGPLDQALSQFGRQAGIALSTNASLTAGKTSAGLQGEFSIEEGFRRILAGSGYSAAQQSDGSYLLVVAMEPAGAMELSSVTISGKAPGSTTEGTGLYNTYSASSSTRLNLTPKETPQSVTVLTRQRLDDQKIENMVDALEATPGITVSRAGVDIDNDLIYSRGFILNNFAVDGVRTSS